MGSVAPVSHYSSHKSGKFIFSAKYNNDKLIPYFIESSILFKTINDLPILPRISSQIQEDLIKRSIFSTAALEGNPLTESKVNDILDNPTTTHDSERAQKEIYNLKNAYSYLKTIKSSGNFLKISEKLIRNIHNSI